MKRLLILAAAVLAACSPEPDGPWFVLNPVEVNGVKWADRNMPGHYVFGEEPCPAGWRVPTMEELTLLTKSGDVSYVADGQSVRFKDAGTGQSVVLPLAGYRLPGSDKVNGEGSYGCYWSGDAGNEGFGLGLTFFVSPHYPHKVTLAPADPAAVDTAQSVRCVAR
jgi:hypothetical protein